MALKVNLTSFENASLLRKLTIFYFVFSVVPFGVLYYLYTELKTKGRIEINADAFNTTLIFVGIGVFVGYFAMRAMISRLVDITRQNTETLEQILGPDKIRKIADGSSNEIAILAKSFNEITSRLEENIRNLELAKKTLHSVLSRVGQGLSSMQNIDSFLELIVETMTDSLQSKNGALLLIDPGRNELVLKAAHGEKAAASFPLDSGIFASVMTEKKPMIIPKIAPENAASLFKAPLIVAPMVLHDHVIGVMAVWGRIIDAPYDEEELNLFNNLALQTAVAVENARLNEDAEKTYFETISALALAVEARDPYSRGHSERVAKFSVAIGKKLTLTSQESNILRDSARLHDIGKIGVTDKVLKKEGPLTTEEMDMMKRHCEIGEGIIKPIRSLRVLCDPVRHHHEKLDGSGYPDKIKGTQITLLTRILTVADIYDALTSNRSYRNAFSPDKAVEELRKMKDQLDQKIVDALIEALKKKIRFRKIFMTSEPHVPAEIDEQARIFLTAKLTGIYALTTVIVILIILETKTPVSGLCLAAVWFLYYWMPLILAVAAGYLFRPFFPTFRNVFFTIFAVQVLYSFTVGILRWDYEERIFEQMRWRKKDRVTIVNYDAKYFDRNEDGFKEALKVKVVWDLSKNRPGEYFLNAVPMTGDAIAPISVEGADTVKVAKGQDNLFQKIYTFKPNLPADIDFQVKFVLIRVIPFDSRGEKLLLFTRWAPFLRTTTWEGDDILIFGSRKILDEKVRPEPHFFYALPTEGSRL